MKIKTLIIIILLMFPLWAQKGDTVTASGIIEKYISSIGGREKLAGIEDRVTEMSGTVHNLPFKTTVYQKKPDKFKQVTELGEVKQTVLYDGSKGVTETNGEKKDVTGDELLRLKTESNMNLLLEKDTNKISYEYKGIDTVAGKDAYKVLAHVNTFTWTQYYDITSGFKVKDAKPMATPQGVFTIETWYSDYRQVEGLWFPFKLKQQLGKQVMEFSVTSIKVNTGLEDSIFTLEEPAEEK